jgi:zinc protease
MRIKRFFVAAALLITSAVAVMAQEMPPIPIDDQVRIGKLDNGLTYYIRHNEYPEHVANFYIAQRVGSIQEEESQRGLAHFLEHMAFNGSENFPGNGIIDFTRGLGVEFGSDLNAYTSIDQTVYRVCNVPTKRITAVDSCLLILKDWSNGLLLQEEEIVKERDVVHNEWRMGESASQRIITRALPKLYPGSKYGERMPIGLMSVIDSFKPKTLMDYYHKWYRPDNQALIIVGDVDVDHIEAEIKRLFSGIKVAPDAAKVVAEEVPDNAEPIFVFEKDKEMPMNQLMVMMKTDATPEEEKSSMAYLIQDYLINVISSMFNSRFSEMTEDPECPFVQAFGDYGQYLLSKTKDNMEFIAVPKEGKDLEALKAIIRETRRVSQFGFTATEYERAKSDYLASLEKSYTNRDKRKNDEFGNAYRDHFLSNEPIPSLDYLYQTMNSIVPMLPIEIVNQVLPELIADNDSNLVVMDWAREAEGLVYPTEADMQKAVAEARAEQLQAYVDNVKDEPLILPEKMPKMGKIKKETSNATLGYKELTLSNGATVLLKKTDFKDDEVRLQAFAKGGKSLYGPADYNNLKVFDEIIGFSGIGNFSSNELQKALAGKNCNADATLGLTRQYITANSTPKDLETMFQMMYLYFTNINKDEKMVSNLMTQLELALKNKNLQPQAVFSDSITNTIYCHNPRFANIQAEDLKDISYDRILEIAKDRFKNAGQFTFVITGNFDEAAIRPLIEQYVASLPGKKGKGDNFKDVRTFATGKVVNNFTIKTDSPNAMSYLIWSAPMEYNLENDVKLDAVGQILSQIYLATIREEESAAYTCGAQGSFDLSASQPLARLFCITQGNPEKNARAVELLYKGIKDNSVKIDTDALNKVKEYMLKQIDVDAKTNGYWINTLTKWKDYGLDFYTDYKKVVSGLTAQSLQEFLQKLMAAGNQIECIMMPEPKEADK